MLCKASYLYKSTESKHKRLTFRIDVSYYTKYNPFKEIWVRLSETIENNYILTGI